MTSATDALNQTGYTIVPQVYSAEEVARISDLISSQHGTRELFGERNFLQRTPGLLSLMLNQEMRKLLAEAAPDYTIIKSIYFDKAPGANWFVSFHRDQIIFVKNKIEAWGFKNWTNRGDCFGVQPSPDILGNMVTIRIHLDDADQNNGALKVIPYTHSEATVRSVNTNFSDSDSVLCPVRAGGVMLMKPLLFHASSKSASDKRRRVIHLELCGMELPEGMEWAQKTTI